MYEKIFIVVFAVADMYDYKREKFCAGCTG